MCQLLHQTGDSHNSAGESQISWLAQSDTSIALDQQRIASFPFKSWDDNTLLEACRYLLRSGPAMFVTEIVWASSVVNQTSLSTGDA